MAKGKLASSVLDQSTMPTQLLQKITFAAVQSYPSRHYFQETDTKLRRDKKSQGGKCLCDSVRSTRETASMSYIRQSEMKLEPLFP